MFATACLALPLLFSAPAEVPVLLPLRERAALRDAWLRERLDSVIPELMRREGIDAWVLIAREYAEDPVLETMLPATWLAARRRTILVFCLEEGGDRAARFAVARYAVGDVFPRAWEKEKQPDQWARLAEILAKWNPEQIAIDVSPTFALADGLTASERDAFEAALPDSMRGRLVSAEPLAIGWLETRIPQELEVYPSICRVAHEIIAEGLSNRAVQPGHTTTSDLEWWYRERIAELRLDTWFHPSVSVQRAQAIEHSGSFASDPGTETIRRGDLVHVDFGIDYLGLTTDTQQHAYVLRPGEEAAPAGIVDGLRVGNRLQDLLVAEFQQGRTGNEILAATLAAASAEGIDATIYTHPLGFHGHGAGPLIGLWDQQDGVPGRGDYPLHANTAHSIELSAAVTVPEWGDQRVSIMLEEDAVFDGNTVRFLDGRQTELILID